MCVCVAHPLHLIGDGDFQQGREVSDACAAAVSEDGQLGQIHVQSALLRGHSQQLTIVRPTDLI